MNSNELDKIKAEAKALLLQQPRRELKNLYPFWPSHKSFTERLGLFWNISKDYPWQKNFVVENHLKMFFALNSFSVTLVGYQVRSFFGLNRQGQAIFNTLIPSLAFSTLFGCGLHLTLISDKLVKEPIGQPYCLIFQSSLCHLATSVLYPLLWTSFSSLYFAAKYNSYPIPKDIFLAPETRAYIRKDVLPKFWAQNKRLLIVMSLFQLLSSGILTFLEAEQTRTIFFDELKKFKTNQSANLSH